MSTDKKVYFFSMEGLHKIIDRILPCKHKWTKIIDQGVIRKPSHRDPKVQLEIGHFITKECEHCGAVKTFKHRVDDDD